MAETKMLEFDFTSMDKGFKSLREFPESKEFIEAGKPVGKQMLKDMLENIPTVPKDTGELRGSGSAFSGSELIAVSADIGYQHNKGTPATSLGKSAQKEGMATITVGFNTAYAAKVHEMPAGSNWTTEGSGAKYIQNTLQDRGEDYMRMWFEAIKEALRKRRK